MTGDIRDLEEIDYDQILAFLNASRESKIQAAQQLGIDTATFYRKQKLYK
jgi:transcriptional regulator with PAS, ATPase and Fis domain